MFDTDRDHPIPPHLDEMPPGPVLGTFLASIDADLVSGHDRVVVLQALQRQASHFQARVYAAMASVADHMDAVEFPDDPELSWHAAATEVGAALRLTRRSADGELDLAVRLRRRLPQVWAALEAGDLDRQRTRVIVTGTDHLPEDTARRVTDSIITDAPRLTTGQLTARLRRVAIAEDPESAESRYRETVERRRVITEASPDGTAHLHGFNLPPDRVAAISSRIDRLARRLHDDDDTRSIDQRRADVFIDLLAGNAPGGTGGVVDIRVDLETLAGLTDEPGDLAGYGPVIADIARQVADTQSRCEWRFSVTDPESGEVIDNGTTRRRPSASQRRHVEAREPRCIFPGCRMPATRSDLDHRVPWARSGRTSVSGLDPLCRHHHVTVRHRIGWTRRRLPNGDHLWTGPLGHRYTTSGRSP